MPGNPHRRLCDTRSERPVVGVTFSATALAVRRVLGCARARLARAGLPAAGCDAAELVLAEALNNVIEHAYGSGAPGTVRLRIWRCGADLVLETVDRGRPLPEGRLPTGRAPVLDGPLHELPEGGFGWFLIREFAREVHYRREGAENRLRVTLSSDGRRPHAGAPAR